MSYFCCNVKDPRESRGLRSSPDFITEGESFKNLARGGLAPSFASVRRGLEFEPVSRICRNVTALGVLHKKI